MKVVFAPASLQDLKEIADYIAKDNKVRAKSFVRTLRTKARQIGRMPHAFPLVEAYHDDEVRRRPFQTYVIFYLVQTNRVTILRILHGARDLETIMARP